MSSIGSTLNQINSALLNEINADLLNTKPPATNAAATTPGAPSSDQINFSQVGQLFQELSQLQTQNPSAFQQVMQDAVTKLQDAAKQQTDPNAAQFLNNLADRFQQAANTGNLSALQPANEAHHAHGHHHHHHAAASDNDSTTSAANAYQPAQTTSTVQSALDSLTNGSTTGTETLAQSLVSGVLNNLV